MRLSAVAAFAAASLAAMSSQAAASCVPLSLGEKIAMAEVIAFGTVADRIGPPFSGGTVTFRAQRVYKGALPAIVAVRVGPGEGAVTSVDYRARSGTDHVLYLRRSAEGYETNDCAGSHPGPATSEELRLLGAGFAPGPTSWSDELLASPLLSLASAVALLAAAAAVILVATRRRARPRPASDA